MTLAADTSATATRLQQPGSHPAARTPAARIAHRLATPLTTGLFAVSVVSGVALFFHWLPGAFHSMHVWLSMVLLLPFALHVWRNWNQLLGYAKRGTLVLPLVASLAVAAPFAVYGLSGAGGRGNPGFRTMALMTQTRLTELAPVQSSTPDALLAPLRQQGFLANSTEETLETVGAASGKPPSQVLLAVMPPR